MLHLILGRAGSGKTTRVHQLLEQRVSQGELGAILLVPEQYSFYSERAMLERLGPRDALKVEVLSFTRLAHVVFKQYGGKSVSVLDDSARALLMSLALESVGEKLTLYGRHKYSTAVIKELLELGTRFKRNTVTTENLFEVSSSMDDGLLKQKISDLALIFSAYRALTEQGMIDGEDELTQLYDTLLSEDFFNGKTVAVDAFTGFTGQEFKVMECIISQAKDTYVTLCTDSIYSSDDKDDTGVFSNIRRTAGKLIEIAKKQGVSVAVPELLEGTVQFTGEAQKALAAIEAGLYEPNPEVYEESTASVVIAAAEDIVKECEFVAANVKKLLREKSWRCKEIAIIARTAGDYEPHLKTALKKCGVPVFIDSRQPLINQPLITLVRSAIEIAAYGFSADAFLRCLKTGLAGLSLEEVSLTENYILLWNISGERFLNEWRQHPGGFAGQLEEGDVELLNRINKIRQRAVEPLQELRDKLKRSDGLAAASAIWEYLKSIKAGENLKELAIKLDNQGETVLALEQERIWDELIEALDIIALTLKDTPLEAERLFSLFDLIMSTRTLGSIPQGLDEITIGSADRIRTASPRAVFVVGANEGVFPRDPISPGILTDHDWNSLIELGLPLEEQREYQVLSERFITYTALCGASEKLFISYSRKNLSGGALIPSEIVTQVQRIVPECTKKDTVDVPVMDYIEGEQPAFELTAKLRQKNDELYSSLRAYFETLPQYGGKLAALDRMAERSPFEIKEKETAEKLFGKKMSLSASRVEQYYKCPFAYFCKYGLRAEPRKIAQLDPLQRGNVVHFVLEKLFFEYPVDKILAFTRDDRVSAIKRLLREFVDKYMGGLDDKEKRFEYLYLRLADVLDEVVDRLIQELSAGKFEPVEYELKIGSEEGIAPYEVQDKNGLTLEIRGSIDRVDRLTLGDKNYIRILDYKSSGKAFNLFEVLEGLNMQMLLYLFAVWKNGQPLFGHVVPAGVLFVPVKISSVTDLDRNATAEQIEEKKFKLGAMTGMVLADKDVILGMDSRGTGVFIPAKIKNGEPTGVLITLTELEKLKEKADELLLNMAQKLCNGKIPALPSESGYGALACNYCDYKTVCRREEGMPVRTVKRIKHEEALELLNEEEVELR